MFEVKKKSGQKKFFLLWELTKALARPLPSGRWWGEVASSFAQKMGWKEKVIVPGVATSLVELWSSRGM